MKEYPLDIETLVEYEGGDWGDLTAYYSKGHHPADQFVSTAIDLYEPDEPDELKPENVKHTYYRKVPWHEADMDCTGMFRPVEAKHPGPGAFPVTVLEVQ